MAVVFKATSEFDDVLKDYDKLARKVVALEQKNKQLTDGVKNQGSGLKSTFQAGLTGIKSMVSGYVGWQAAITLVNQSLAEQNRLSEESRQVQMTAADAQAEVIKNLGNVSTDHASKFLTDIQGISKTAGAESVAPVLEAAASTLSGTGGNEELTQNILREAVPLFRNKLDQLPDFAGAVGDLATIAGAESQEEIRRTVGLVLTTQSQARITSLDAFKNVAPALAAVATTDTSGDEIAALREGGALFAAIGGAIKDPEGALTKTATSEFATSLQELLPENDILNVEGDVVRKGTGLKTLGERLARVQGDETLQREFMQGSDTFQKASFRGPITPVISELISNPDSEAAQRFKSAFATVQDDPAIVNQMLANLDGATSQLSGANFSRRAMGNIEGTMLTGDQSNRAIVRNMVGKTLEQTRTNFFGHLDDRAQLGRIDASSDEELFSTAESSLRLRAQQIRSGGGGLAGAGLRAVTGGAINISREDNELTGQEQEQIALIKEQLALLRDMREASQKTNEHLGQLTTSAAGAAGNRETR